MDLILAIQHFLKYIFRISSDGLHYLTLKILLLSFLLTLIVVILCAFDLNIVLLPYSEAPDNITFL